MGEDEKEKEEDKKMKENGLKDKKIKKMELKIKNILEYLPRQRMTGFVLSKLFTYYDEKLAGGKEAPSLFSTFVRIVINDALKKAEGDLNKFLWNRTLMGKE